MRLTPQHAELISQRHASWNPRPFLSHCEAGIELPYFRYLDWCFPDQPFFKYSQCPIPLNHHMIHTMNNFTCSLPAITKNSSQICLVLCMREKGDRNKRRYKVLFDKHLWFLSKIVQIYLWITFFILVLSCLDSFLSKWLFQANSLLRT